MPFAASLTLTPARSVIGRCGCAGEVKVTSLQGVEFGRARFDAEFLGDGSPPLLAARFVYLQDPFMGYPGKLTELKDHEDISRLADRLDNSLNLR
jgi:hypothetical protein